MTSICTVLSPSKEHHNSHADCVHYTIPRPSVSYTESVGSVYIANTYPADSVYRTNSAFISRFVTIKQYKVYNRVLQTHQPVPS